MKEPFFHAYLLDAPNEISRCACAAGHACKGKKEQNQSKCWLSAGRSRPPIGHQPEARTKMQNIARRRPRILGIFVWEGP